MDDKVTYFIAGATFAVTLLKVLARILRNETSDKRKK